jgi:L-asparaginase
LKFLVEYLIQQRLLEIMLTFCGVSLTGVGEDIMSNATAAKIATRVTDGFTLEEAAKTFEELKSYDGFAAIAIDSKGTIFHHDSHPSMVFASFDGDNFEVLNIIQ